MLTRRTGPTAASEPLLRSAGFAAVAVPTALAGHVAGGGSTPDQASVLLAIALCIAGHRLLLAATERSWAVLTLALAAAQVVLHLVFAGSVTATGHAVGVVPTGPGMQAVPCHDLSVAAVGTGAMVAGHALAAVVFGFVLRRGEAALWSAAHRASARVRRARARLLTLLATPMRPVLLPATPSASAATRRVDRLPLRSDVVVAVGRRRGPPVAAASSRTG